MCIDMHGGMCVDRCHRTRYRHARRHAYGHAAPPNGRGSASVHASAGGTDEFSHDGSGFSSHDGSTDPDPSATVIATFSFWAPTANTEGLARIRRGTVDLYEVSVSRVQAPFRPEQGPSAFAVGVRRAVLKRRKKEARSARRAVQHQ